MIRRIVFALLLLGGCTSSEYTDRSQYITITEEEEIELGRAAYQEMLSTLIVSRDPKEVDPVVRVGRRLAAHGTVILGEAPGEALGEAGRQESRAAAMGRQGLRFDGIAQSREVP